jgi:hypothetical protein
MSFDTQNTNAQILAEVDKISNFVNHNTLSKYTNNFDFINKIKLFHALVTKYTCPDAVIVDDVVQKSFKYDKLMPLFTYIVDELCQIYSNGSNAIIKLADEYVQSYFICWITHVNKGQHLLKKLDKVIIRLYCKDKHDSYGRTPINMLLAAASYGTMMTWLYWLDKTSEKKLANLKQSVRIELFISSIANPDDRLYKYILENILSIDKLFFQKKKIIEQLITKLSNSSIPDKYFLRRVKLLSQHVSLVPFFEHMMTCCANKSSKIITMLHKYYYVQPHVFATLVKIVPPFVAEENIVNQSKIKQLYDLLKTSEEKIAVEIIIAMTYSMNDKMFAQHNNTILFNKVIQENYTLIIKMWQTINYQLPTNPLYSKILHTLTKYNLITQFIEQINIDHSYIDHVHYNFRTDMIKHTRFLKIPNINNFYINPETLKIIINTNRALHYLRLWAKRKFKNIYIERTTKMFHLLNEIRTWAPNNNIPVMANGSYLHQLNKQKFSNLPPRHLLPGEINVYNQFLLREKPDGILINNLPVGIFPFTDIISNYQVSAEYIEELDLYLVFDIDIPHTTILERYNILRQAHPSTHKTVLQSVDNLEDFIKLVDTDRNLISDFIKTNTAHIIKWFPKFACINSNNLINQQLINKIILNSDPIFSSHLLKSNLYNCDGLILTPLNGDREIKIKPLSMMTIDLLFSDGKWIDRDNVNWSHLIVKPSTPKKDGKIYRCYPVVNDGCPISNEKTHTGYYVGEFRYDKKQPNPYSIVDSINNMLKYNWTNDLKDLSLYYYDAPKKIFNKKIISMLESQTNMLVSQISVLEPSINKKWIDLGSGKSKLVPIIKHYSPKYYLGVDIDVCQLVRALKYHDENQIVYNFSPCDLSINWNTCWASINTTTKFDYVIANFSLMHFFTDAFWTQLDTIVHAETKFIFNLVCAPCGSEWKESNSFIRINADKVVYKFEWVHDNEKTEPIITEEQILHTLTQHNWNILSRQKSNTIQTLSDFYEWWTVCKN